MSKKLKNKKKVKTKKIKIKNDLRKNRKNAACQLNFIMICIIHKISVSFKVTGITLKIVFSKALLRSRIGF